MDLFIKHKNLVFITIMITITTLTYLNHFDNSFHFDDFHTITKNPNIRSIKNIPLFFKDGSTISTLPQNQAYRPILATSLAIDYWIGNGYNLFYFHLSSYILFIITGILLFLFASKVFNLSDKNKYNFYIAAALTLWYMIHPVMAETVNYIIARSDLQSTFFVVLAFILYQYSKVSRKYFLYLIPVIIGALAKPTTIMFAPLLIVYIALFEEEINFTKLHRISQKSRITKTLYKSFPALIACIGLYFFQDYMTPSNFSTGSSDTFRYLITQPSVIFYYFGSIFLPIHLSADTDWSLLNSIWSIQFILGIIFVFSLIFIAFICSRNKKHYPIAFGILWFFIALAPTSSFIPLGEVMNDHRMFFPYIGLIIAVVHSIWLLIIFLIKKHTFSFKYIPLGVSILIILYGFGTVSYTHLTLPTTPYV